MLLAELHKNILNLAKGGGLASDDSRLGSRLIKYWIRYYRAALLNQYTDFGKDIPQEIIQDLGCLTLTNTDKGECPVIFGCDIKKVTIPGLVDFPKNRGLVFVGLIDKQEPFHIDSADTIYWTRFRRFTSKVNRAYLIGNTLYVVSPSNFSLKYINVRGVFENPEEITKTDSDGNVEMFKEATSQYPIPETMVPAIVEQIMTKELRFSLSTQKDLINDSTDGDKQRPQ